MTATGSGFFNALTPAEIYHQLREGRGSQGLHLTQLAMQSETFEEQDRADLIASLGQLIETGWQGQASAAASGAARPLRDLVLQNADKADQVQDLLSRQIGSFERAYHSVRPVVELPEQMLDEPVPFDVDHAKAVALYQAVAQHNIAVFQDYDGASSYNETNMPQEFHAGGRDGGDVSVKAADSIAVEPRDPREVPPGGEGLGVVAGPRDSRGAEWPGAGSSGYPGAGYPGGGSGVSASGAGQAGGNLPPGSGHGSSVGGSGSGGSGSGGSGAGGSGFVGGVPAGGSAGVGRGPLSGHSGGRAGVGNPGAGASGGRPSGGGSRGAGGPGGALPVRGPGGVVGVGALAAEESAVRRGAAAAPGGRQGLGAVGAPAGGGRGSDDEDSQHERKVLIEVDAEEIFGSDVLTAPPVIGDDEFED